MRRLDLIRSTALSALLFVLPSCDRQPQSPPEPPTLKEDVTLKALTLEPALPPSKDTRAPESATPTERVLRVCADPNNLPFSNEREEGFENKLANLVARELGATLKYTWWVQHRGFFRNTLNAGRCDLVMGVPVELEMVAPTEPVYRSSYVFVTRAREKRRLRSFDDPSLKVSRIGVHLIGDDYANTPPVHALSTRGIVDNLVGFRVTGDHSKENPPARLVEAVAEGVVDVAVVWGPLGGYFAKLQAIPLNIEPVLRDGNNRALPLTYDIAFGVRKSDTAFKAELNQLLSAKRREIRAILKEYRVPLVGG